MRKQLGPAPSGASDAATKGYVDANSGGALAVSTKTANYTITTSDTVILADTSGGGFTVTLPTAVGATKAYTVKKTSPSNTLVIASTSGTIDGSASISITVGYTALTFVSDGTNWNVI